MDEIHQYVHILEDRKVSWFLIGFSLLVSLGCQPLYRRGIRGARRLERCSLVLTAVNEIRRICFSSACF